MLDAGRVCPHSTQRYGVSNTCARVRQTMKTESKLAVFLKRQRDGVRFCALFTCFTVLVFAGLYAAQHVLVVPLNHHFAWISAQCLRLVGGHTFSSGPVVSLS